MFKKNIIIIILFILMNFISSANAEDTLKDQAILRKEAFKTIETALFDQKIHTNMKVDIFDFLKNLVSKTNKDTPENQYSIDLIDNTYITNSTIDLLMENKEDNVETLNSKLPDEALSILSKALTDSNRNMNFYALEIIDKGKIKKLLPETIMKLESIDPKDQELIITTITTLGKIGDDKSIPVLEKFLSNQEMRIRITALQAISEIPTNNAKKILLSKLRDSELELALLSAGTLANEGNTDAIKLLNEGIKSSVDSTRAKTIVAMTNSTNPILIPILSEAMKTKDDVYKEYILCILGNIKSEESVKIIKTALNNDSLISRAYLSLANNSSNEAFKIFETTMESKDLSKKMYALYAMTKIEDKRIIPALKIGLKDDNETIRVTSAKILHSLKDFSGISVLNDALKSEDRKISLSAATFLGYIGNRDGSHILKQALNDIDLPSWQRLDISIILDKTGDSSVFPKIEYLLEQQRLSSLPNDLIPNLETLKKLMENDSKWVKLNSSLFLSKLKVSDYIPTIEKLAADNDIAIRVGAIKVLGKLGSMNTLPILEKRLTDESVRVRVNSAESIIDIISNQEKKV